MKAVHGRQYVCFYDFPALLVEESIESIGSRSLFCWELINRVLELLQCERLIKAWNIQSAQI
jgi:hypothetical protein